MIILYIVLGTLLGLFIFFFILGMLLSMDFKKMRSILSWSNMYKRQKLIENDFEKKYFMWKEVIDLDDYNSEVECYGSKSNNKYVLFQHGLKCDSETGYKYANMFFEMGYNIITFDARGWRSSGMKFKATAGIKEKEDLFKIGSFLKNDKKLKHIVLMGESMGGGSVNQYLNKYADKNIFDKYIVDSGYKSFVGVIYKQFFNKFWYFSYLVTPFLLFGFSIGWLINTKTWIYSATISRKKFKKINAKVLYLHSKIDDVVDVREATRIQKYKNKNFNFVYFNRSRHVRIVLDEFDQYQKAIKDFL